MFYLGNPSSSLLITILRGQVFSHFVSDGDRSPETLSDLPKVTPLASGRAGFPISACGPEGLPLSVPALEEVAPPSSPRVTGASALAL